MAASTLDITPEAVRLGERTHVLPAYSLDGVECVYQVGRRDAEYRKSIVLRLVLWALWQVWGIEPCLPHEYIGPATTEAEADAACLDETYYYFPQPLNRFLPAGRQRIKGLRWPRRGAQIRREPPEPDYLVNVRESDLRALHEALGARGETVVGRLASNV